jgi:hypothetical protein
MRNQSTSFIISLLALVVFGSAVTIHAQTAAKSCSYTDVLTAVQSTARGGTVTVPAGNCSWGSTLTLTQGVTLQGAGVGSTVITNGGGDGTTLQISPDSTAIANDETIKVTGFTFDGAATGYALIGIYGAPDTGTKPFKNLIIATNKFQNTGSSSGQGNTCIYNFSGQTRGLIYNNTFDRCDIILRPMGSDSTTEWENTAYNQFSYGSADNLYFEDNTILYSVPWTSAEGAAGWVESGQGGRIVVRFNTWNMANAGGQSEFWDVHGFQNFYGSPNGQTGTMIAEYYSNKFSNGASSVYRWIDHRGSWGMFFNNTYSGASSPDIEVNQYNGGCTNQIVPAPTNYNPLVNNTYVFNNTVNGTIKPMVAGSVNSCGVTQNVNWWNYNSSFNGTTGIGYGVKSAMPGTCTTGVGYWVTDEGSWNTKLQADTSGQFYKCVSTNNWQLYYTPYTYPHPLQGDSGGTPTNLTATVH